MVHWLERYHVMMYIRQEFFGAGLVVNPELA